MSPDQLENRAYIERVHAGVARLLVGPDEDAVDVAGDALPAGAAEDDWVVIHHTDDGCVQVVEVDHELTEQRRRDVRSRLDALHAERPSTRFTRD